MQFVLRNLDGALEACQKGLALAKTVDVEEDLDIRRSINNSIRDMLNIIVRITVKQDKTKNTREVREQLAAEHNLDNTFMPRQQDILDVVTKSLAKQQFEQQEKSAALVESANPTKK